MPGTDAERPEVKLLSDFPLWKMAGCALLMGVALAAIGGAFGLPADNAIPVASVPFGFVFVAWFSTHFGGNKQTITDFRELVAGDPVFDALDPDLRERGIRLFTRTIHRSGEAGLPFGSQSVFLNPDILQDLSPEAQAWLAQVVYLQNVPSKSLKPWMLPLLFAPIALMGLGYRFQHQPLLIALCVALFIIWVVWLFRVAIIPPERAFEAWVRKGIESREGLEVAREGTQFLRTYFQKVGPMKSQFIWMPDTINKLERWAGLR